MGCDAVSLDDGSPALRESVVVLSSRITMEFFMYLLRFDHLVVSKRRAQSRSAASLYSRGTETSAAPLRKSQDLQLYQAYIHKVLIILNENFQRESHKPYSPPTSVT